MGSNDFSMNPKNHLPMYKTDANNATVRLITMLACWMGGGGGGLGGRRNLPIVDPGVSCVRTATTDVGSRTLTSQSSVDASRATTSGQASSGACSSDARTEMGEGRWWGFKEEGRRKESCSRMVKQKRGRRWVPWATWRYEWLKWLSLALINNQNSLSNKILDINRTFFIKFQNPHMYLYKYI